jgi:hypothetical protein
VREGYDRDSYLPGLERMVLLANGLVSVQVCWCGETRLGGVRHRQLGQLAQRLLELRALYGWQQPEPPRRS